MKRSLALISILAFALTACGTRDTKYDTFAQCLDQAGAKFYGAFWCPHCKEQKELFGDSEDLLPYVECAEGGKNAQPELCAEEGIKGFPTWKFKDGTVVSGSQSLEKLSEYTTCPLPGEETSIMNQ